MGTSTDGTYGSQEMLEDLFDSFEEDCAAEVSEVSPCQGGHARIVITPGGRKFLVRVTQVDE